MIFCISGLKDFHTEKAPANDVARFLAAMELPPSSPLYPYTRTDYYRQYKTKIIESWQSFQQPNLGKIREWRSKHIRWKYTDTVLYPFSGPDITNALAFYPKAHLYIMFGMETPGQIPKPLALNQQETESALKGMMKSLGDVLRFNFFITSEMEKEVGTHQFNGILGMKMLLLARYGCRIIEARHIWIDPTGTVQYSNRNNSTMINGCEIIFKLKGDKSIKTSQFFQINVSNESLLRHTNFITFLKKLRPSTTLLKAASYLMHRYNRNDPGMSFSIIRSIILNKSQFLIQDDSGIPLAYFPRNNWDLVFYGSHEEPIEMFDHYYQEYLVDSVEYYTRGWLPFSYGYYIHPGSCHIMIAISK